MAPRRLPTAPAPTMRIFTVVRASPQSAHQVGKARSVPEVAPKQAQQALIITNLLARLPDLEEEILFLPPELPDLGHQLALGRGERLLPIGRGEWSGHDGSRPFGNGRARHRR